MYLHMALDFLIVFNALFRLFQTGESLSDKVHQTQKDLLVKTREPVTLTCSHKIPNYYVILWYEQLKGDTALNLN